MKAWWFGLQASERRTLMIAAPLLFIILIYFAGWEPLQQDITALQKHVTEQRAVKSWMQQSAAEVKQLRGSTSSSQRNGRSLLAVVDQTTKQARLGSSVKRLEPAGSDSVKVMLEEASFDDMMAWLQSLEQSQGLTVATISIDRQAASGRVNARLTLQSL